MFDTRGIAECKMVTIHSEDLDEECVQGMIIASNEDEVVLASVMYMVRMTDSSGCDGAGYTGWIMILMKKRKRSNYIN